MPKPTYNRTKIVSTMGPACADPATLREMILAGIDVCRLNASHGNHEFHQGFIDRIRAITAELGTQVSILLDLQGPKIRIGELDEAYPIKPGDVITLSTSVKKREGSVIPMVYETFAKDIKPGDTVLVEDGKVELKVLQSNGTDTAKLEVVNGTSIGSRKGVNLPNVAVSLPSLTEKDLNDLELGLKNEVDWIALSFVRRAEDVISLKNILRERKSNAKVIAKIEKPEALRNIDAIIDASDGIMVARGDLGVEIPTEDVPFWQKKIVRKCNERGRPVIVATQMLESMIENSRPTRAEATDVANAVIDGADAVMVSGETSVGKHPLEVIRVMQRIVSKAELEDVVYNHHSTLQETSETFLADSICLAACQLSVTVKAKAIVSMTRSGYTAYQISRHRPESLIFVFTDNRAQLTALNLVWGVRAYYYDKFVDTDVAMHEVLELLRKDGHVTPGDIVVNTAALPLESRDRTNMLKVNVVA